MQIGVGVFGHVIIEHNIDAFNVHTTTEQICGDENSFLEILKLLIAAQAEICQTHLRSIIECTLTVRPVAYCDGWRYLESFVRRAAD